MSNGEFQDFELDVDLDSVEAWDGEQRPLVPAGAGYHAKIVNVTNEGKFLAVTFEIDEGEHAGSKVYNNYNFGNKVGKARLKALCIAVGAPLGRINGSDLVGQPLYFDVVHNMSKGGVSATGEALEPRMFANVIRERAKLDPQADGDAQGDADQQDPEPPPAARGNSATAQAQAQAQQPAADTAATNGAAGTKRTTRRA
jgi:hypothetical protein